MSFEIHPDRERPEVPFSGTDINNREEQEKLCREYVEQRGGVYVGTYDEPDTSAWKKKRVRQPDGSHAYRVVRPVFEGMLKDLKNGQTPATYFTPVDGLSATTEIDGSIVYDIDRLTRDNRHLEDAIETVEHFHRPIIDITGTLDLLTENGRDMARVMVTMAGKQSSATSRRVRNIHRAMAREGIPVSGSRPFGWMADKRTADPEEAKYIRDAACSLLDGVPAYRLLKQWEEQNVRTPKGNYWVRATFIHMMISPRLVGWRVYGGPAVPLPERYYRDAEGNPVKGQYDSILDERTWRNVVNLLAGPDRPGASRYVGNLKYLCSGHLRCGNCGSRLRGNAKPKGAHEYVCDTCHKVTGAGKAIDKLITELVLARLAQQEVIIEAAPWPNEDELKAHEATKASLLDQFKENPDMGSYIWPEVRKVEQTIAQLSKERRSYLRKTARPSELDIVERWPSLELEQQRDILDENFEAIILNPATKRGPKFDSSRLQVVYR
ncbi:recombinase family protein [Streptacidiphilus sp. N1-10]|uniref:Recombinase family protein n=1 Tax=Streptacidiphilus jeojiensis TaxID=3229225 RepID=A0ABV6XPG8_9ACTN